MFQFICLYFGLDPASKIFTKLMKIPVALLRKLMVGLMIFLDNILLMVASIEELALTRDSRFQVCDKHQKVSFASLSKLRVSLG